MDPEITIDRTFYDADDNEYVDVPVEFRVKDDGNKILRARIDGFWMERALLIETFGLRIIRRIEECDSTFEAIERALKERCE